MTFCKNSIRISCQIIFVNKHWPQSCPCPFKLLFSKSTHCKFIQIPGENDNVMINQPVLLDVSPPSLSGIVIETDGRLVWSPGRDFHLKTKYIHIFGKFEVGSEQCRFAQKAKITLTGTNGYSVDQSIKVIWGIFIFIWNMNGTIRFQ